MEKHKNNKILNFRASDDLIAHLQAKADGVKLELSTYVRALVKKHSKYKEKKESELV